MLLQDLKEQRQQQEQQTQAREQQQQQQTQWQLAQQHQKEQLQLQERLYWGQQQNVKDAQKQQQDFFLLLHSKGIPLDADVVRSLTAIGGASQSLSVRMPSSAACPTMPVLMAPPAPAMGLPDANAPLPSGQLALPSPTSP